jgi:hypothetical protein
MDEWILIRKGRESFTNEILYWLTQSQDLDKYNFRGVVDIGGNEETTPRAQHTSRIDAH